MEEAKPTLIQHLERYFGVIEHGFRAPENRNTSNVPEVQFIECRGGSVRGVTIISTLGLSNFDLASAVSEKRIRQELFLMVKEGQSSGNMPAVLHQIVNERKQSMNAVLRGEAIRKSGTLFEQGNFVALYSTLPIHYPEEMWTCRTESVNIVFCWLLPITQPEWMFHAQNGWSKFETLLNKARFDLFDLNRPSIV